MKSCVSWVTWEKLCKMRKIGLGLNLTIGRENNISLLISLCSCTSFWKPIEKHYKKTYDYRDNYSEFYLSGHLKTGPGVDPLRTVIVLINL